MEKARLLTILISLLLPTTFAQVDTNQTTDNIRELLEKQLSPHEDRTSTGFFNRLQLEKAFFEQINHEKNLKTKKKLFMVFGELFGGARFDNGKFTRESKQLDLKSLKILNRSYLQDKKGIYYLGFRQQGEVFDRERLPIINRLKEADPKTFEIRNNKAVISPDAEVYESYHLSFEGTEVYFEYAQDKNNVYSNGLIIPWADPKSYHSLPYWVLAKDKNQIFFRAWYESSAPEHALGGVDPATFKILNRGYAKDKKHVYMIMNCWGGSGRETCIEKIEKADPKTFVLYSWENKLLDAYDKNALYLKSGQRVEWGDQASLESIGDDYLKDKNYVYGSYCWLDEERKGIDTYRKVYRMEQADPKTFELVCREGFFPHCSEAKDKNFVYSDCSLLTGEDPKTFDLKRWKEQEEQKKSNNSIGAKMQAERVAFIVEGTEQKPSQYRDLSHSCWRYVLDTKTNEIFYPKRNEEKQIMEDFKVESNPKTFRSMVKVYPNWWAICNEFAYDEKGLIYQGKHYPFVDTWSLEMQFTGSNEDGEYSFIRDNNQIFLLSGDRIIPQPHLDRKTFKAYLYTRYGRTDPYENLFVDKRAVYRITTPLIGFSIKHFTPLGMGYFRDNKKVYYAGKEVKKANPQSFHTLEGIGRYDAYDNNHYYQHWEIVDLNATEKDWVLSSLHMIIKKTF